MNDESRLLCRVTPSQSPPVRNTSLASFGNLIAVQYALSPSWFTSDSFVRAVRADIGKLLLLFQQEWNAFLDSTKMSEERASVPKEPVTKGATSQKLGGKHKLRPSVFTAFKHCWVHLGWDRVHFSMVDPCLRTHWFRTMTRLLMGAHFHSSVCRSTERYTERLFTSRPNDLHKVGALLALYTFWASQPSSIPQEHIIVDLGMLQLIDSAPRALAYIVDATLPNESDAALKDSDDLFMAVHLLHHSPSGSAFILAPQEAVRHPPLPSNQLGIFREALNGPQTVSAPSAKRRRAAGAKGRSHDTPPKVATPMREPRSESLRHLTTESEASGWAPKPNGTHIEQHAGEDVDTGELQAAALDGEGTPQTEHDVWRAPSATLTQEEVNELLLHTLNSPPADLVHTTLPKPDKGVDEVAMQAEVDLVVPNAANDYLNFGEG